MMDLEFYESVLDKVEWEGIGYYILEYGNADHFNGDLELREAFVAARQWVNRFEDLLAQRIEQSAAVELHG